MSPLRTTVTRNLRRITTALSVMGWVTLVGLLTYSFHAGLGLPRRDSFAFALLCGIVVFFGFTLVKRRNAKSVSGRLIFDCGPNPSRTRDLRIAVIGGVLGAGGVIVVTFDAIDIPRMSSGVALFATFSALIAMRALGHLQIRENGLWAYCDVLWWSDLSDYRWDGSDDCKLMLTFNDGVLFPSKLEIEISAENRAAVLQLLKKSGAAGEGDTRDGT